MQINKISIKNLSKKIQNKEIYKNFNLNIEDKKITAVFGPNGCGKSTLLNIIAKIYQKDNGNIEILNFDKYKFSYLFQNYTESLLPWKNNFENIALPLKVQKLEKKEIKKIINQTYKKFDFDFDLLSYPYDLSGGQRQMVAFMRSIITKPNIILLDEPFSALDYENSFKLKNILQKYYTEEKPTIFIITHNIEEAVYIANKIIVLSKNPTNIGGVVENNLAYPRTIDTLSSSEFQENKNTVLKHFKQVINT